MESKVVYIHRSGQGGRNDRRRAQGNKAESRQNQSGGTTQWKPGKLLAER